MFYNVATVLHYVSTKGSFWTKDSSEAEEGQGDFDTLVHCGKRSLFSQLALTTDTCDDLQISNQEIFVSHIYYSLVK